MITSHSALLLIVVLTLLYHESQAEVIIKASWLEHKRKYGLSFDISEDEKRRNIFEENLLHIQKVNAANLTYKLEMNHFGHLTHKEITEKLHINNHRRQFHHASDYDFKTHSSSPKGPYPDTWDWREHGAVTPVGNHSDCGSSWAFSAVGAVESHYKIKFGELKSFSKQQLVDCDNRMRNIGCAGGLPYTAMEYIREDGILTEEEYPYIGQQGKCKLNDTTANLNYTHIRGYSLLDVDEEALTRTLYEIGPVSILADAHAFDFYFYKEGVYYNENCKNGPRDVNYPLLAVGYGFVKYAALKYYILQNSWSEEWGEGGYMRIIRNYNNACGTATFASYPVL